MAYFKEKKLPAHAIKLNVTDRVAYAKAAAEAEAGFGKIHVLVNNAGVGGSGQAEKLRPLKTGTTWWASTWGCYQWSW